MSEAAKSGRIPFNRVDIEYDRCSKDYAVTCGAILGTTGERKCYKTKKTCQAPADYALQSEPLFVSFSSNQVSSIAGEYVIPSLVNASVSPAKLNPAGGGALSSLGQRSTISLFFQDHSHTDRIVDPYIDQRISGAAQADGVGYDPYLFGTFWGKWFGRQQNINSRQIRYVSGYIDDAGIMVSTTTQIFYATGISGPEADGSVSISGIDPLGLIRNDKAQSPKRSIGKLSALLSGVGTAFSATPSDVGATYPASGTVRIDDELMTFTRSGDSFTVVRARNFTSAVQHNAGALVQIVEHYSGSVSDLLYRLLVTEGGIPAAIINKAEWDAEIAEFNPAAYSAIIAEPTGIAALVSELCEQSGVYIWYDGESNLIRLRTVRKPSESAITVLDDDRHVISDSLSVQSDTSHYTTQVWVSFAQRNPTKSLTDAANYAASEVIADLEQEGQTAGRGSRVRQIYSRWIEAAGGATALSIGERILGRYRKPINNVSFLLDAKDSDVDLGDFVTMTHRQIQDEVGRKRPVTYQVISRTEAVVGSTIAIGAQETIAESFSVDTERRIIIAADLYNVNLRTLYDQQYPGSPPLEGDEIRFVVRPGVIIGGLIGAYYPSIFYPEYRIGARLEPVYMYNARYRTFQQTGIDGPVYKLEDTKEVALPPLQRRAVVSPVFRGRYNGVIADRLSVGRRGYLVDAICAVDTWEIPTGTAVRVGSWPEGVILTLELQPGARIMGEGGSSTSHFSFPRYMEAGEIQDGNITMRARTSQSGGVWLPELTSPDQRQYWRYSNWADRFAPGGDGGDAILADYPIRIVNNGTIGGGGGGGGGGVPTGAHGATMNSAAPGGGQGFTGGAARPDSIPVNYPPPYTDQGRRGSPDAPGAAWNYPLSGGFNGYIPGDGMRFGLYYGTGRGGYLGGAGQDSRLTWHGPLTNYIRVDLPDPPHISSGGLAGRAVVQSVNVEWLTRGVVMGAEV